MDTGLNVLLKLMTEDNQNELDRARECFDRWDKDANGTIDWDEFCQMLDELSVGISLEEKTLAFHLVDLNHTGLISCEEFSAWWLKRLEEQGNHG